MRRIRTAVAIGAAALGVAAVALFVLPSTDREAPVARITTDRAAPAAPTTTAREAAAVRIMALGDSITDGAGSSTGSGYREDLGRRLAGAGYRVDFVGSLRSGPGTDPDHEGHSGWRIDQLAAGVDGWLRTYQPDVVLLHAGTNDMNQNYASPSAAIRLGALLDQILADRPAAVVLVALIVPSKTAAIQARVTAFNAALPAIAAARGDRVRLVDLSGLSAADDLADALHPNDRGYARMAQGWFAALAPVLAARP